MARKPGEWQPSLDFGAPRRRIEPAEPREPAESHVEYDPTPRRKPASEPVFQRPTPVVRPSDATDNPWWDRVAKQSQVPRPPPEPVSWSSTWRGLLSEAGWFDELPAAHRAMLEACVRGLEVRSGVVEAGVGKRGEKPQRVQLRLGPFSPAEWARVVRRVVDAQGVESLLAELDQHRLPMALLDACDACEFVLAPKRIALVVAACTCGSAGLPCDHVLATHLAFARRVGQEPLSLVAFRGAPADELRALLARVREEVSRSNAPAGVVAVDPFAAPAPLAPDWSLLEPLPPPRAPLPPVEGWRAPETFDALHRRLLAPAREACARRAH